MLHHPFKICVIAVSLLAAGGLTAKSSEEAAMPEKNMSATQAQADGADGKAFLKENQSKPNVVVLADGLQYKIIKKGTGPKPKAEDTVTVSYEGKRVDGTEFDNSKNHGGSVSFPVSGVIRGWTEALQLMPSGSIWELYIPAELAYGEEGAPPVIGPNQALVFKVHLLSVQKAA